MNSRVKSVLNDFYKDYPIKKFEVLDYEEDWIIIPQIDIDWDEETPGPVGVVCHIAVIPKNDKNYFILDHFCFLSEEDGIDGVYNIRFTKSVKDAVKISKLISSWTRMSAIDALKKIKSTDRSIGFIPVRRPKELKRKLESLGASLVMERPNNQGGYF